MPTMKEVQEQVQKLNVSEYVMKEGVIQLLPIILHDGEEISKAIWADSGWAYGEKHGCLMATSKRILFVVSESPGNSTADSFWYDDITSLLVREKKNMRDYRDLVIYDGVNETAISGIFSSDINGFMDFVLTNLHLIQKERNGLSYFGKADMGPLKEMPATERFALKRKVGTGFVYATELSWIGMNKKTPVVPENTVTGDIQKALLLNNRELKVERNGRLTSSLLHQYLKEYRLVDIELPLVKEELEA